MTTKPKAPIQIRTSFTEIFPPEIRNMIYELLPLISDMPIQVTESKNRLRKASKTSKKSGKPKRGILRVDRQTYLETSRIFYSNNQFEFGTSTTNKDNKLNLQGFKQFIARVPKQHLAHITKVKLNCQSDGEREYASAAEWCWVVNKINKYFTFPGTITLTLNFYPVFRREQEMALSRLLNVWFTSPHHEFISSVKQIIHGWQIPHFWDELADLHPKIKRMMTEIDANKPKVTWHEPNYLPHPALNIQWLDSLVSTCPPFYVAAPEPTFEHRHRIYLVH